MSQILSQLPRQLLRQEQRLTPQLIQAMDILQLNALALESRIAQELDSNPALESVPGDDDVPITTAEPVVDDREGERALVMTDNAADDFARLADFSNEYDWLDDEHRGPGLRVAAGGDGDAKLDAMANTAARPTGLAEHLIEQWALIDVEQRMRTLGLAIIAVLEDTGRLETPLEALAEQVEPPATLTELEDALFEVQQLEPPGVGARTTQECLLLQLDALPGDNRLERRILTEHFEDLQKNRLPAIARALNVDLGEVKDAIEALATLKLHPGLEIVERQSPAIVPDLIVEYDEQEDQYTVRLARGNTRDLRISPEFREMLELSRTDPKAREFVRQKIEAASAIIDALRFRRDRLLEVGKAVIEAQREFLDRGEQHLKVLRMSDLAERFRCDPSTISRTVDEKYMQTPRGIFPLRMFFTGGASTGTGDELGWASIRAKVQEIIEREDKASPLSDDAIVDVLKGQGIEIRRRTVAKYRAQLNIPAANKRRQY